MDVFAAHDALLNSQLQFARESYSQVMFRPDLIRLAGDLDPIMPEKLHWPDPAHLRVGSPP